MLPNDRRIDADTLTGFLAAVLTAAGASKPDADCVAAHLADANLKGHDSHGAGLLPVYVHHIRKGLVETEATPSTLTDTAVLLRVDGHGGWGAPAGFNLIERAGHKAKASGLAAATLGHVHHLGRIGAYGERAAAAGLASIHFVSVGDHAPLVAPFRGSDARFGTNPVCIAFPATANRPAFVLDMATSRIALGKARVAANKGIALAEGNLTDPGGMAGFELKGALTPMGRHKGYGLAFACEILAGVLSGAGTIQPRRERRGGLQNGLFSILIDPAAFGDPAWMEDEIEALADYVLASPPMDWDSPVLYPGDPERAAEGKRRREGIPMDDNTIAQLNKSAEIADCAARL